MITKNIISSYQRSYFISLVQLLAIVFIIAIKVTPAHAINFSDIFSSNNANTTNPSKPLPVQEAFAITTTQQGNQLTIQADVKDGYFVYQDKLKLELPQGVNATPLVFDQTATFVNDPSFGRVPIIDKSFTAKTTLSVLKPMQAQPAIVKWQGCAKMGLCYPPEKVNFTLQPITPQAASAVPTTLRPSPNNTTPVITDKAPLSPPITTDITAQHPSQGDNDIFGLSRHTGWALLLLFLAGLGLSFTPCVLPMLPIVVNIVARQHSPSAKKGLLLTGSYGVGVATSYGLVGALVAVFGQSLGLMNMLQQPIILLSFATVFVLLGLYMLDAIPFPLSARLSRLGQTISNIGTSRLGSMSGSFITGFFSAMVVSPCVSAPLAGALAGVATLGNPVIGFFALFLLGLGLSTPLIILGATQGNFMPKTGEWMVWVKTGFALMLFAVALVMIERVLISHFMLGIWAIWFMVVATWLWHWQGIGQKQEPSHGRIVIKAIALITAIWASILLIGMALGSQDSWQPLKTIKTSSVASSITDQSPKITKIYKMSELNPILANNPKVLVDVTADWCITCRTMDKTLFETPPAQLNDWQVIKMDVTDDTVDSKEVYQALDVFAPPALLYYQEGKLVARQDGNVEREVFEKQLAQLNDKLRIPNIVR